MIDAFVDELYLAQRGFERAQRASTGRPGYAPGTMLKLYVYGYLHQLTSSRKLSGRVTASKSPPAPRQASFPRCPRPTRPQPRPVAWESRRSSISLASIPIAALPASSSRPLRPAAVARRAKRRIRRREHEAVCDAIERKLDAMPDAMAVRRCTVEHVFGWMDGRDPLPNARAKERDRRSLPSDPSLLSAPLPSPASFDHQGNRRVRGTSSRYRGRTESSHTASATERTLPTARRRPVTAGNRRRHRANGSHLPGRSRHQARRGAPEGRLKVGGRSWRRTDAPCPSRWPGGSCRPA